MVLQPKFAGVQVTCVASKSGIHALAVVSSAWMYADADSEAATALLLRAAIPREVPHKVHIPGPMKPWAIPLLKKRSTLYREHDLLVMTTNQASSQGVGRLALESDIPSLEVYQDAYNRERHTSIVRDWSAMIAAHGVFLLEDSTVLASVICGHEATARFASVGGTWTNPARRRRGHARSLTTFAVGQLLLRRPFVHLVVDDDNVAAVSLYCSIGFKSIGKCSFSYWRTLDAPV